VRSQSEMFCSGTGKRLGLNAALAIPLVCAGLFAASGHCPKPRSKTHRAPDARFSLGFQFTHTGCGEVVVPRPNIGDTDRCSQMLAVQGHGAGKDATLMRPKFRADQPESPSTATFAELTFAVGA